MNIWNGWLDRFGPRVARFLRRQAKQLSLCVAEPTDIDDLAKMALESCIDQGLPVADGAAERMRDYMAGLVSLSRRDCVPLVLREDNEAAAPAGMVCVIRQPAEPWEPAGSDIAYVCFLHVRPQWRHTLGVGVRLIRGAVAVGHLWGVDRFRANARSQAHGPLRTYVDSLGFRVEGDFQTLRADWRRPQEARVET
jgi:ribosomal protein S18 acetylase RimI-like enzyme